MAESSAGSSFDCLICSESFEVNGDLVDHLCEHLSYRKYRCGSCEKTFITERKQKKHCEKKSHFRIYQPSINLYNELLLEQFQEELAFLRGGGDLDQLIAFKQNSLWKLQNVRRDLPSHGRTDVLVHSTYTNSAEEKRVMSSTPQDANGVVNKNTATGRTIQSARAIVKTESIPSPPSGFTNNTKAANPTTPSSRSRGTTWYAQPKPIPLGSSDSESDDDDSTTQNTHSRDDVAQRKVTPSANSYAMSMTSISTPKSTVVQGGSNVCGNGIDKRVVSSSPQDANREIVHKKTTNSFTIQRARSIVKEEIIPSPPSGFTNKTKAANPTTPSSRSYGTTWYAQPKPMPICSSDSESDDDDSSTQNTQSREDVAQRKVSSSANSYAMSKTSISTPKSTVVQGGSNVCGNVVEEKCSAKSSPVVVRSSTVNKKIATNGTEQNTRPTSKSATTTNRSSAVVKNTVPRREENTTSCSSSKRNASTESREMAVVRCASDSDDDDNVRSSSTTGRVRQEEIEGAPRKKQDFRKYTRGKSKYGEGEDFLMVLLSGSKKSSLSWISKPVDNVTCEICRSHGPGDYVSRRQHVSSFHLENDDLTLKRYWHSLEAQMQKAYPGMTYSDLHCQYPGCPEKEYFSQNLRRKHTMKDHSSFDLCCVIDGCSFLSTNAPEMELHLENKHALPNGSKSLSPLLAAAFVSERRSKHHQLAVLLEFCFPFAIPLQLASQSELRMLLGETCFREDLDLLEASLCTIFGRTLHGQDGEEVPSSDSGSSARRWTRTSSYSFANGGFGTTSEIAIDPVISSLDWELFFHSSKATCQFCNHEGSSDYVYRKYHVASKHTNHANLRDTDYYDVLQAKMLVAYPGMTFSDMQCQYPGCGKMYTRQSSRNTHVWKHHALNDMRCIYRECTFLSSCAREMEEHLKAAHNQPNGSKSLGILEVAVFVSVRRRKIRQVAAISECCFPCRIPLHASKTDLKQLMIDALGHKARPDDEIDIDAQTTPTNSNEPVKRLKRKRVRPDEFSDQFTVVERLPLAMRTITPQDRARMMKFAPMRRRFASSSESESDDEEETTEAVQGVVAPNDGLANKKLTKTNETAAKVPKIEISSSDDSDVDASTNSQATRSSFDIITDDWQYSSDSSAYYSNPSPSSKTMKRKEVGTTSSSKANQIDLIVREEERRMWKRDRRTIFFDGIQKNCSLKSISRVIPDFETIQQSDVGNYGSLCFKTRTLMLKSFRKLTEVGDPRFGKPSYRKKQKKWTGSKAIDWRALFVEGIPRTVFGREVATAFPGVRGKVRIFAPKYERKHRLRPNNALVWFDTAADAKKAFDGGGKLKIGGQRVDVFYARN